MQKAKELSLTEGIKFSLNNVIDRQSVALMIDRALMEEVNGDKSKKTKLIKKMDYKGVDHCVILSANNENKALSSDEVATSEGIYKTANNYVKRYITQTGKRVLNKESKIISIVPIPKSRKEIIIQGIAGNEISYTEQGKTGVIKTDSASGVYYKNEKYTFEEIKKDIESGAQMTIYYDSNNRYDYSVLTENELIGPIVYHTFNDIYKLPIHFHGLRVVRDGHKSSIGKIVANDVLYYDSALNIIYAYCDKVSGVYEEAISYKTNVTKIMLSGVEYDLETQEASKSLGEYGNSFEINDYLTALLGKDGDIVEVIHADTNSEMSSLGLLLSCDSRVVEGKKTYYVTFVMATGEKQEFKTDKNYDSYRGKIAKYQFEDGILIPTFISTKQISGSIDEQNKKIGYYRLTDDCKIIDLLYASGDEDKPDAIAKVVELSEITAPKLFSTDVEKLSSSVTYEIDINGETSSYYMDSTSSVSAREAVMAMIIDNQLLEIKEMKHITTSSNLVNINHHSVKIGTINYSLADDAVVYLYDNNNELSMVSIDDIQTDNINHISLYGDKSLSQGGLIRVIICR